jgi:hypothetical protein
MRPESTTQPTDLASGLPETLKRIDAHYVSHEIQHLFHLESGFLYTVKELLLRPGKAVREFLFRDRSKLVKPIVFVVFIAVIFTVTMKALGVNYTLLNIDRITLIKNYQGTFRTKEIGDWLQGHLGYWTLIMSVFIALFTQLVFRKRDFTTFEILVLMCYATGEGLLLLGTVMASFELLFVVLPKQLGYPINMPNFLVLLVAMLGLSGYLLYPIWAIGQFFGERKILNYVKAAISFVLGILAYQAALVLLAWVLKLVLP